MRFTYEQLLNTFNKNVNFLSKNYPQLLEKLNVPKGSIRVSLDNEGRLDALVGSIMVYGGDAYRKSLEQVERFEKAPVRLLPNLTMQECTSDNLISSRHCKKIQNITGLTVSLPQHPKDNYIPFLVVIGLGFGLHIKLLLERYTIQNLMIVDIPLFAHLSLYTLDWENLITSYSKVDRSISLFIDDGFLKPHMVDEKVNEVMSTINLIGPMVVYWGYYFEHLKYNPPILFREWLSKVNRIDDFFKGYFDDELWSLDWTLEKVERRIPLYYGGYKVPKGSVAFVLGAGPSLDPAMEKLFKYKNKAVIFSCGSTITALEKVDLVPDFHVEIERTKYTYDVLSEIRGDFLKKTILMTENPLWTDCFDLFKKGYMFLKLNDTGSSLFEEMGIPYLPYAGPTVTAGGVAIASELGFDEIYLIGVDLGSRDPRKHHSSKTNYFKEGSILYNAHNALNFPYEANFGGIVYTNSWFAETGKYIEKLIRTYKPKVFNLSDGIKIEGAIPMRLEDFDLSDREDINKELIMDIVDKNFSTDYVKKIDPQKVIQGIYKSMEAIIKECHELSNRRYPTIQHVVSTFMDFNAIIRKYGSAVFAMLYHNSFLWATAMIGHVLKMEREEERNQAMREFWTVYKDFLTEAKDAIKALEKKYKKTPLAI